MASKMVRTLAGSRINNTKVVMKKLLNIFLFSLLALISTSCLKGGLDELPNATGADIVSVNSVKHRWIGSNKNPASGELEVLERALTQQSVVNKEQSTLSITVRIPSGFPADQVAAVSTSKLIVALNLSSAAHIEAIEGAPALGIPGDWSKANKYRVRAGDGTEKIWTITLTLAKS